MYKVKNRHNILCLLILVSKQDGTATTKRIRHHQPTKRDRMGEITPLPSDFMSYQQYESGMETLYHYSEHLQNKCFWISVVTYNGFQVKTSLLTTYNEQVWSRPYLHYLFTSLSSSYSVCNKHFHTYRYQASKGVYVLLKREYVVFCSQKVNDIQLNFTLRIMDFCL